MGHSGGPASEIRWLGHTPPPNPDLLVRTQDCPIGSIALVHLGSVLTRQMNSTEIFAVKTTPRQKSVRRFAIWFESTAGRDRGDIVREIIEIVGEVAATSCLAPMTP